VIERLIRVECYSGYKANERPECMQIDGKKVKIVAVEDRWYSPGMTYFRVRVEGGDCYVLRHAEAQDGWTLEGFRAARIERQYVDTKINRGV